MQGSKALTQLAPPLTAGSGLPPSPPALASEWALASDGGISLSPVFFFILERPEET